MKKLAVFALVFALCFALLAIGHTGKTPSSAPAASPAAAQSATPTRYSTMFLDTFDTVISLIGYAESEAAFTQQANMVHETYLYLHKLFDNYNSYESEGIVNVYSLNERAAIEPVAVDPLLFGLLTFSKSHYALAQGQTNVAMGSVLRIWHEYREEGLDNPEAAKLPPMDELKAASKHVSIDDLILDPDAQTVYFADPQLKLDVGAVAKGYATEIVAKALLSGGMPSFVLSAGGNVRTGISPMDERSAWGVGIQDPDGAVFGNEDIVEALYLSNLSVVTSGDYQRFYEVDGQRYHHLIDPDTLMPGAFFRSVSIITEDSGLADFLSTAAFLMPYEQSRAFIESLDGVEAIWLFDDGSMKLTEGAKAFARSYGATNQ